MFMKRSFLLLFLLGIFPILSFGQDLDCRFEKLFLSGNMVKWEQLVDSLQKAKLDDSKEEVFLYVEYELIAYYLNKGQKVVAEKRMVQFEHHIKKMLTRCPTNATYLAFDVALASYNVNLTPWKAMILGPLASAKLDKALQYHKNETLPIIEHAKSLSNRPALMGGDKQKSKVLFEKAFEQLGEDPNCNWMYFKIGSTLGQLYTKLGEYQKAREIYLQMLNKAPDFVLVKNVLLPQLSQSKF